uniref:Uncharacterized protein n=1 Tax=Aegilops tauschii subsp. strangulata TaxID=200361 RepID=A0A453MQB7_AEGTS
MHNPDCIFIVSYQARDVYILGSANVGKSAFISAMLKTMAYKDPVAAAAQKYKPIQSAVPGTTLGPIQIEAFLGGGKLYDTPGVHLHHRQAAVIHADDLPSLAPQSRLKGRCFPANDTDVGLSGNTLFWGGLVRIDVVKALPRTRLTFYGPKKLSINMVPTTEADEFYKREVGVMLTPPTGQERAEGWCGLQGVRELQIKYEELDRPASDIAISGLGWIAVEPLGVPSSDPDSSVEEEDGDSGELHLRVHVPKPVEVFVRAPLPVGKAASQWYRYQELTEVEEELRPKWHY